MYPAVVERARARLTIHEHWRYPDALRFMEDAHARVVAGGAFEVAIGVHDPAVVTLGRHTDRAQILDEDALRARGIDVVRTERGGGATLHLPGQIVLYPVVSLPRLGLSVPAFVALLESVVARALVVEGIGGVTTGGRGPGVFVGGEKIAALGLRARYGVVTHGLSFNVDPDLELFRAIAPCGRPDVGVTSVAKVKRDPDPPERSGCVRHWINRLASGFAEMAVLEWAR